MLILKTDPQGMDIAIQRLQEYLHDQLIATWGLGTTPERYACYGRTYRNKTQDGYVAEAFAGGNDYKDVYWDDNLSAISFFGQTDPIKRIGASSLIPVHLIFFVDLAKLKPAIAHRADEEVRLDVKNALSGPDYGLTYESTVTGLDQVLKEYTGSIKQLQVVDMQPRHCFRFNFSLLINQLEIC